MGPRFRGDDGCDAMLDGAYARRRGHIFPQASALFVHGFPHSRDGETVDSFGGWHYGKVECCLLAPRKGGLLQMLWVPDREKRCSDQQ
jgi:hypothetical protein